LDGLTLDTAHSVCMSWGSYLVKIYILAAIALVLNCLKNSPDELLWTEIHEAEEILNLCNNTHTRARPHHLRLCASQFCSFAVEPAQQYTSESNYAHTPLSTYLDIMYHTTHNVVGL
jgi:hypothetical protein